MATVLVISAPFRSDALLRKNGLQEKRTTKATLNSLLHSSLRVLPMSGIATSVMRHCRTLAQPGLMRAGCPGNAIAATDALLASAQPAPCAEP